MWLREKIRRCASRLPRQALIAGFGSLLLAGCLQPVYGPLSAGGSVESELQAIQIDPISDRLGHYLGNELIFNLNGTGSHVPPKYRLKVVVFESVQTPLIDTVSGRASAATVVVNAIYILTPVGGDVPITKGTATVTASYDRNSQRFANLRAARDAEIRDAKALADQIRLRLATAFAAKG
ncbi:LPS assembly lipoprotein LptE [Beijerinckia indica]|uniref:LPS-assembly lipoprotein n=1 Tax=Beijerinckia indica subsp. indica (strain ATCC 9039 / DSM 1715 / NCIMB 8712) TaxID=395963 RepID=B2ICJ1_BEII9|nr:LPS assembly lipoprotein LptE [Beijerinckia indica]ACB93880.1 conserved hypothetical protein [Beijerinckia indica subsp. indica ATCC 9039]